MRRARGNNSCRASARPVILSVQVAALVVMVWLAAASASTLSPVEVRDRRAQTVVAVDDTPTSSTGVTLPSAAL